MSEKSASDANEATGDLEARTRRVSLIVSLVAVGLMILGFGDALLTGTTFSVPGSSVLPVPMLLHLSQVPVGLAAMSTGVLLLALLPTVRVLLAAVLYISQRGLLNALVSLVVLVELIVSIRAGS